jgi:general secretion pathway protein M
MTSVDMSPHAKPGWVPLIATAGYVALIAILVYLSSSAILDLIERRAAIADSTDILERLQARRIGANGAANAATGSPFIEGPTVTVAGAALMQRVASAITHVGGTILSSQVELQGSQAKAGYVTVTTNCEVDQPALQELLYDLEAGLPYLFIDQLTVQAPMTSTGPEQGHMRVLLTVSGQWQGRQ